MSPDIVRTLVREAGYEIIKSNYYMGEAKGNLYYDRDIVLLIRPSD